MKGILNSFTTLISIIKTLFSILMSIFETIAMVFKYLITIVQLAFNVVLTIPPWLRAFAIITIAISIAYVIIGRNTGKSD